MCQSFKVLLTSLILPLVLVGCNQSEENNQDTESQQQQVASVQKNKADNLSWLSIIEARTEGYISSEANIHVVFNQPVVDKAMLGSDAKSVLNITPALKGKAVFETEKEVIFIPDQPLTSGAKYQVDVNADALKTFQAGTDYSFVFHVIPLDFEIRTEGLQNDVNEEGQMQLQGELLSSDHLDPEAVKKVLSAKIQDKALKITWKHADDGKEHRFVVSNISRDNFTTDLKLNWNAKSIGLEKQGSKVVRVPALDEMSLLGVAVVQGSEAVHAEITFSDNLDNSQSLTGLVELVSVKGKETLVASKVSYRIAANRILVYPTQSLSGEYTVRVHQGIRSVSGKKIKKQGEETIAFEHLKPQVKFVGKGSILPDNNTLAIPIEAVSVDTVQVTAFEIYPDNLGQFLQSNSLSGDASLGRVGRYLWRKTIKLNSADTSKWNRYSLDATELLKAHPNSLMRLKISVDRRHSTYKCEEDKSLSKRRDDSLQNYEDDDLEESSGWDGIESYEMDDYKYEDRNNPCTDSYFISNDTDVMDERNFITSNIGLLAKQDAHGELNIIATDLRTAEPIKAVALEVRNFQGEKLAEASTDGSGFAKIKLENTPFLLIATTNNDTAYLKLNAATALATSHFDVGGEAVKNGLKGTIYGERGVWRPGDKIYLTFVLFDKDKSIPENHPVSMKLFDPQGREVDSQINKSPTGDFYTFQFKTDEKAPTGKWSVKALLGANVFTKVLNLEMVRPNRLKVELDFVEGSDDDVIYGYEEPAEATLFSQWLHGGNAGGLKADVSVRLREKTTKFTRFSDYKFDDPTRSLDSEDKKILEGYLDDVGYLKFTKGFAPDQKAPGLLSAWFTSRVFEKGGAFSISRQFVDYHQYKNYVGLKLPKGDATRKMLLTDKKHTVQIGSLNAKGEPASINQVQVTLYKIDWKWWWDKSNESLSKYADANHSSKLQQGIVSTQDGQGEWQFEIKYPEWGRYLIRACDLQGGHCTGKIVYIDWPGWAGRAQEEGSGAASMLTLGTDKKEYKVGDIAKIQLPKATQGRALLTIETGGDILRQEWLSLTSERSQIDLPITEAMAPNVYFSLTLIQPHQGKNNDRPIRLYGITPIKVINPQSHLQPVLNVDEEWKPESSQVIKVSEASGRAMTYTLAIVDEGLLGLTRFKTPELHKKFYKREKLGIKTWDLFDDVVGAYGGELERLLALGGGDDVQIDDDASRQRRFPPVVQFMGPFQLEAGSTKQHEITLPAYLGAVRVMLVAGEQGAYGQTDASVFVRQPLMLQASMPRVVGVGEEVTVPVTLFATDASIKEVQLNVETDGAFEVIGDASSTIHFNQAGEKIGLVRLKATSVIGKGHVHFKAVSGQHVSESDIYLQVRSPNNETSRVITKLIDAGQSWNAELKPHGITGTNRSVLEVSTVPALNLGKHLDYLVRYPHGCLEQTTSSAFPQLYLPQLIKLQGEQAKKTEGNVRAALDRLRQFQKANGDFSYWPNGGESNEWASLYAGHFMLEAEKQGYTVPLSVLSQWTKYQSKAAQRWLTGNGEFVHTQAYRLYILAQAGKAEMGAMNRLRESGKLNKKSRWFLASAYQLSGQADAAKSLLEGLLPEANEYEGADQTFSSKLADLGQQLEALVALKKNQDADLFVQQIADELNRDGSFHNTHGIAWALSSVSRYLGGTQASVSAEISVDGQSEVLTNNSPFAEKALEGVGDMSKPVTIKNTSDKKLYASVTSYGVPLAGDEQDSSEGLKLSVLYDDASFAKFKVADQLGRVVQGGDITINITLENTTGRDLQNVAMTLPITSGWEVHKADSGGASAQVDYMDVRDDRIHRYFDLKKGESKIFRMVANATYRGKYYLPAITAEVMYEPKIKAMVAGQWLDIVEKIAEVKPVTPAEPEKAGNDRGLGEVIIEKAWLYDDPTDISHSALYLIKGDKVTILKFNPADGWMFIRFEGKKTVEMWIKDTALVVG